MTERVQVVGGGLAGSECAWQLARRGVPVIVHEMRPDRPTPAHTTGAFAELVCSNSLRSDEREHPAGLLKREMERFGSLVIAAARARRGAGGRRPRRRPRPLRGGDHRARSLAHPLVRGAARRGAGSARRAGRRRHRAAHLARASPARSERLLGEEYLYFYDAIAPIVDGETLDMELALLGLALRQGGRRRLPQRAARPRAVPRLHRGGASRPRSCRCTTSSRRSSSRGACRSRRWRGAAPTRCATGR